MLDSVEFKYTCTWKINTDSNVNKLAAVDCNIRYDDAFYLNICMFVCLCIIRFFFQLLIFCILYWMSCRPR